MIVEHGLPQHIADLIEVGDCWEWKGRISQGYGDLHYEGETRRAHRVVYLLLVGEVPECLDHLCRNRKCVNPDHLEGVTRVENIRRSPLSKTGSTHCKNGHPRVPSNTYTNPTTGARRCCVCQSDRNRSYRVKEQSHQHQ